ncbi:MAG TPA: hypothetical protein VN924_19400 [Bryobacteraceae bacterium]|nr:hypothetical protein [Bryobacteraceae bacterium]
MRVRPFPEALYLRVGKFQRQIQIGIVDRPQSRHRPGVLDDDDILALPGQID